MINTALALALPLVLSFAGQVGAVDTSAAPWVPRRSERADVPAGSELRVQWETQANPSQRALITVSVRLAATVRLSIAFQPRSPSETPLALPHWAQAQGALAAINGGYFQSTFLPTGLVRGNGRELATFSQNPLLSGCLVIDGNGHASLVHATDAAVSTAPDALQSGPFLIDPGGSLGIRRHPDIPCAARSVIACSADGQLNLIVTSPVTLADLSTALHDHPDAFGLSDVERCLNLDGGPSTSLMIRGDRLQTGTARDVTVPVMLEVLPRIGPTRP